MTDAAELKVPALRITQGSRRVLYSFGIDGKQVSAFAAISRLRRDGVGEVGGYQRPEVVSHIAEIRRYLETNDPMIPNAIVIAFDERVRFVPLNAHRDTGVSTEHGYLCIPVEQNAEDSEKPGWIVDGQQRLAAIRESKLSDYNICAVGFIAESECEQREQFMLVNSTKPLPKSLIYELLPSTTVQLSSLLQRRRFPAFLLQRLNLDPDSPLCGMIQTPTTTNAVIKDNSILRMLEHSLSDGVLYRFRESGTAERHVEGMLCVLKAFWIAVREVFPNAWGLQPRRSRLMHGAGVVSMGFLMDAIADRHRSIEAPMPELFKLDLVPIAEVCRWTDGYWDFGPGAQRKWDEIQNTSKDIQLLANYLLVQYKARVWNAPVVRPA